MIEKGLAGISWPLRINLSPSRDSRCPGLVVSAILLVSRVTTVYILLPHNGKSDRESGQKEENREMEKETKIEEM